MKKAILSLSIISLLLSGCGRGGVPNVVRTPEEAAGRRIGVQENTSSARYAAEIGSVSVYYSAGDMMSALKNGTIDCAMMEKSPATELASKTSGVKILTEPLFECEFSFAVAKENSKLTRAINSALAELNENGVLSGLYDKHIKGGSYEYVPSGTAPAKSGTLILAVTLDFPPYSYKDTDDEPRGFDISVAGAVCDILGAELQILETEQAELISSVRLGKADIALGGLYANEDDIQLVDFTDGYLHLVQSLIVRK